ncbi:MAG: aspartate aminotransferase family protein [Candidatus Bathyarchaeia archaeon]
MGKSSESFERAKRYIPGGVNTSLRSFGYPLTFTRAQGSKIWDADGKEYIDYHCAFGPIILGHSHPTVNKRVFETLETLDIIGAGTTEQEANLAEKICHYIPSAKRVLFCNSGAEATYSAVRLARAVTGRNELIKFQGCYHGWHDALLMNVISDASKIGKKDPLSAGMVQEVVDKTHVVTFNSLEEVEKKVQERKGKIAGIILEPIPHNIGCVLPKQEFLQGLRDLTEREGIVLIFDEVITGFRHSLGGYQKICGITPDITTLGKAIANGYPLAAICGREDFMNRFNTAGGNVFFAGTFNAHPLSTSAALATIEEMEDGGVHEHIFRLGDTMRKGMQELGDKLGLKTYATGFGSVFVTYFMNPPVENYTDLLKNDADTFVKYRRKMVERGIFMLPMNLKRNHITASHTKQDIQHTLENAERSLTEIANQTR